MPSNHSFTVAASACSAILMFTMINIYKKRCNNTSRRGRLWIRKWLGRRDNGRGVLNMVENELLVEDTAAYKNFLRMNNEQFNDILNKVHHLISRKDTNMRECVSPAKRLAITLRFLGTGETYRSLMYSSRIHESTIGNIIPEVCEALYLCLKDTYLKCPNTSEEWMNVAEQFKTKWNFPLCIGALDGKHVKFRPPRSAGSYYYNYKGTHSIVLFALVDAYYCFLYVDVGVNGRISDGGVFRESSLHKSIQNGSLNFPPNCLLPGGKNPVAYTIVADDAFPLSSRLMKPFPFKNLSLDKRIFNYRLSRARNVSENAFGILSNRFRIFLSTINLIPEKVEIITLACVCLHNYLMKTNSEYSAIEEFCENTEIMKSIQIHQAGNRPRNAALQMREEFMNYFNSENGAVPWQNKYISTKYK